MFPEPQTQNSYVASKSTFVLEKEADLPDRLALIRANHLSSRWVWPIEPGESRLCRDELARRLPQIPDCEWRARFAIGGVYVNRERVEFEAPLPVNGELEYFAPRFPLEELPSIFPRPLSQHLLYSDEDVSVVYKPIGVPSTSVRDFPEQNLQSFLADFFGSPVHLPSRLDVSVSGILIASHSSRMNRYLQKAQLKRWIAKHYIAEVEGVFPHHELDVHLPIGRHQSLPMLRWIREDIGESAHTRIFRRSTFSTKSEARSLLHVQPLTGRTHQIRVHCAALGYPIVGDPFYGKPAEEIHLVSHSLEFYQPFLRKLVTVVLPRDLAPAWLHGDLEPSGELRDIESRVGL